MDARRIIGNPLVRRLAATLVLSAAGVVAIISNEGVEHRVYLDPVNIPTVCAGHTSTVTEKDVGRFYSDAQCKALLLADTRTAQAGVARLVKVPITQNQYDALVDFVFNVGEGAFGKSTLLRKLNDGDCLGAAAEFPRWNKAKGRVLPGLTKRRAWEQSIFAPDCP
jgi:lysozyme